VDTCDVVIVGGGPAGSTCAWKLRKADLDVVIVDKATFPRDKVCAGWITPQVLDDLQIDRNDYGKGRTFQPITAYRAGAREAIERFIEVYVDSPLEVCVTRDPKGINRKAKSGQASTVPGVQACYGAPEHPDVVVSGSGDATAAARTILRPLEGRGYIGRRPVSATP
jgi:NADPH-dependent 2,4-dienoyl-CoA reductase/sulfur reductase-like enzyme